MNQQIVESASILNNQGLITEGKHTSVRLGKFKSNKRRNSGPTSCFPLPGAIRQGHAQNLTDSRGVFTKEASIFKRRLIVTPTSYPNEIYASKANAIDKNS